MKLLMPGLLALTLALPSQAADPATDALQQAYAPYRVALFRTNSQDRAEAERALSQAQRAWQQVSERFASSPPWPYAADARFAATLREVGQVYQEAEVLVKAGQLAKSHEVLERVRDLLADLRQRNGVVVFSDAMNDYHAAMEDLLKDGPAVMTKPQGALQLMAHVGVQEHLAKRLVTQAGAALLADAEFMAGLQAVRASVAALRTAVEAQDSAAVNKAIAGLKGPYSRLFLKFG